MTQQISKSPELNPTSEKIDKLINRINSGDIRIPAFQRPYVWKQNQILELLDSVVKNYPIGSILLWSTSERLNHTRNIAGYSIPDNAVEYPVNYVLDGQQRLSSIYATFSDKTVQDVATADYNPDLNIFEIYYDFKLEKFVPVIDVDPTADHFMGLRNFLSGANLFQAFATLNTAYHTSAQNLFSKLINYELPVVTIKNRNKEEVGMIFERINSTGTKLTTLDLMVAWTWTDDFHLLESIKELLDDLEEKNFGEITQNILLQTISAIIQNDTTTPAIVNLTGDQVRDNWNLFTESMRKAIDFLSTHIKCSTQDFLPYQQQIVSICKFFSVSGREDADQLKALEKWFWKTSFSNRYSTGQTTAKMNADIDTIIEIRKSNLVAINNVRTTVTEAELIETKFSKANPLTRAFLLLLAQNGPKDLAKGTSVDITTALSEYNRKQYHHIFPNAFLKKQGFPQSKIFSLVNFTFLPADSNKKISSKKPSEYFITVIPQLTFTEILNSNLIPVKRELYEKDNYNDFLNKRAEIVIAEIDKLTN
ncbi:GmrSD restriction endonuclease domain-containing protein [Mucilaginibacter sp. NFX135]|uniref:GmrSD restriction endonuclease domain-containing protein n=1 Tax=Mucilaginibacter sp. NFX135 TaxID=3402687 RepID=UPI003AFA3D93